MGSLKKGSVAVENPVIIGDGTPTNPEILGIPQFKTDGTQWYCSSLSPVQFTERPLLPATPGGELGGTWASPTVDTTHAGSAHHIQSHSHAEGGDGQTVAPAIALVAPNGAGGTTVDAAGEVTVDTTSRTLNFYDGTAEVVLNPVQSKGFIIIAPVATDDLPMWATDVAITLTEVRYLCIGGTNWVGQLQECDANGINGADVSAADTTAAAGTTEDVTSFSNAGIDAGDWVGIKTTSISGAPTSLHVTFYFRENA